MKATHFNNITTTMLPALSVQKKKISLQLEDGQWKQTTRFTLKTWRWNQTKSNRSNLAKHKNVNSNLRDNACCQEQFLVYHSCLLAFIFGARKIRMSMNLDGDIKQNHFVCNNYTAVSWDLPAHSRKACGRSGGNTPFILNPGTTWGKWSATCSGWFTLE